VINLILLLASFAIILSGALLFTNAIEWLGHKLDMGEGAVGSLLAAVGTAMPETLIPIVSRSSAPRFCSAPSRWRWSASRRSATGGAVCRAPT